MARTATPLVIPDLSHIGANGHLSTAQMCTIVQLVDRGHTVSQICEATGWQQHTVRGTFAGAFKKKLGLDINSTKEAGGERVYRIAS